MAFAAGLFQTAVDLKLPLSVYEYGDEDLRVKGRRDEGEKRGRYQRVRGGKKMEARERFCVSEVLFLPTLWPLVGFMGWI